MAETNPDNEITVLRETCARLEREVATLKEAVQFLAYCKETAMGFAFYDWVVKNDVFNERRARLELVLGVLADRISGRPCSFRKSVPGIPDDRLYTSTAPSRDEARQLLMMALETENATLIEELFHALETQGRNRDLVAWWLA